MVTKKHEEKEIQESIDETQANIGESTLSTVPKEQSLALPGQFRGVAIEGMEDVPASMIALPYLRLIQPSSKDTQMADGTETPWGCFLFSDTQEAVREVNFILLRAKHEMKKVNANGKFVSNDYEGETKLKPQVSILGITTDTDKIFIISLSPTSFSSFGKLIAKFKALHVDKTYRFELNMTAEKTENDKGKFAFVNFKIGAELDKKAMEHMAQVAFEYGLALDRQMVEDDTL